MEQKFEYEIYGSSSKGNSVRINDVLCDIGLPFSKLHDALYKVNYILLTHVHSDHVNPSTYKRIRKVFPNIKFVGNWEVSQRFHCDIIANAGYPIDIGGYTFLPFEAPHNVLVYGYIWKWFGQQIIYVTDTYSLENVPDIKFDWLFVESNHDEKKIEQIENKSFGYDAYAGAKRHLSTQQAKAFYFMHRRTPESPWIELHKSARFY
ncbi:hypothetical protein [Companilactobacillus nodensis]|uniref:Metallo-beta-lactamase domain-containing protein n=1 Tax=Companilactobacillus nodensis DSM 19682 = JCM 14932 = NBRC 107160 TaxID=1423775 RepID=A0A0R1K7B4_9LACO|nr:hypothetical protein [Companilactobacillus nodensis]KRK79477.1 hypothetical protein FD03_GL000607 [Companilactobacillus nodensis DSM 19682 = JCM 14932 = NBRC 107160]